MKKHYPLCLLLLLPLLGWGQDDQYPVNTVIPTKGTPADYAVGSRLEFSGPQQSKPHMYYTYKDNEYNKIYIVGHQIQVIDLDNLTDGLPTATVYSAPNPVEIQRLENSIHYESNRIFFSTRNIGIYWMDRATGENGTIDLLTEEFSSYDRVDIADMVIDNDNNTLYAVVSYFNGPTSCGAIVYGILELDMNNYSKRWITSTSLPVAIPDSIPKDQDICKGQLYELSNSYWATNRLFLDTDENILYFSSGKGLWWWNRGNNETGLITTEGGLSLPDGSPSLPDNRVTHIYKHRATNTFYIGTLGGLFIWDRNNNTSKVYDKDNSAMIHNAINHIDMDEKRGTLFVACEFGGLFTLNVRTGENKVYATQQYYKYIGSVEIDVKEDINKESEPHLIENTVSAAYFDETEDKLYVSIWGDKGSVWIRDYSNVAVDTPAPPTLEAECATIGNNWQEVVSAQASGGKYVTYPNGSYITAPSENPADQLVYTVSVNEAQNYYLMARINAPSYGDDSFWFKIDDNDWIRWSSGITVNKGFQWNLAPGGPFSLSVGTHTLRIAYREDGIQLDKLTLSPSNTLPTGLGEEAQACADDYTPPAPPTVNNPPDATVAPSVSGTLAPPNQSNSNVNFVRSFTPRAEISSPASVTISSNKNDVSISTEYLDGLGRPIQTVVRAGGGRSSRDEDLVQPVAYDAYGRQVKEYLPYAANTATGAYRPNALVEQYRFYTSTGPSDIAKSDYPYAERQYEASPLNRVLEQAAPGENWRIGSGHEVEMQYLVNTESEVRQWTASNNLSVAALSGGTTYYGVGELYKTVTVDENDHTTTEFVNKEGQTVLKRVQGPDGTQDTYYVYDDYNLLRFVLPPEASKQLSSNPAQASNTTFVGQQLYVYTYDGRRRMMSKQVPGGGITRMVYDRWDRLVLTQSPRMRQDNNKQWLYTKYDNLNRPIVTGIYTASQDESDLRTTAMNATGHHERFITSDLNYTLNESFPVTTGTTARTVTYYDDYEFTHASYGNFSAQGTPHRSQVQGQVTGTRVRQLGNRDWLQSVTYYDEQQRPILHLQRNHLGATDRRKTTYRNAVNSEVVATEFKHQTALAEHTVRERYLYDHQGRLKRTWHRLDNESEVVLSTQSYNALGSVGSKALHVSSGSARQNINYRYNIRGWLTHINDLNQAGSYFNQELYYDFGFDKKQHNGNISGVKWNRAGSKSHAYGYLYDEVNRITGADYRDRAAGSWATAPGAFSVDKVGYDQNGNIEQLKRYGLLDERLHLLDDLSYTYQGNRLRAVQDAGEAGAGFVDGAKVADEYRYDEAGNLISDKNKNITNISYDPVLNLPLQIDFANGSRLEYVYDATGTKLQQKVVQVGGKSKITDYVQGFHYEDNKLSFLRHDEGRLMMDDRAYHYDLKDHLGNSRVTFSSKPVTTTAMASMEMSAAPEEEAVFEGVAESRQTLAFHNTTDASIQEPEPQQVATLLPGEQALGKSLQVYQGDTIRLKVNARYETTPQQVQGLEGIATEVVGAVEKTASGLESSGVSEGINGLGATGALANDQQKAPQAYLNYLVYDEDYQLLDQGFVAVSEAAAVGAKNPDAAPEELALEVPIEEDGFVYAYLSNGVANSSTPVHFDDFTVEQQSYIVQVEDFYPFGLTHQQPLGSDLPNRYLFNGKELTNDFGLGMYDYGARQYMPDIGRWTSIDPMASKYGAHSAYSYVFNNPIIFIDPDGEDPIDFLSGFFNSVASNHHPTQAGRGYGQPLSGPARNDYNAGQRLGDYVSYAMGVAETISGGTSIAAGVAAAPVSGGASLALTVEGALVATEGLITISNATKNLSATDENGRVNASSSDGESSQKGKDFDQAREEAFDNAGLTDPNDVEFSKVDPETGTVVEFKGSGDKKGAKVGYDGPHDSPGPHHDVQHISWQTSGKRKSGGTERGNTPYEGPWHPSRQKTKD